MTATAKLTDSPSKACLFGSEAEALNAGEDFCHANMAEHGRSNVDVARREGGWVAVITREGEDFDNYIAATSRGIPVDCPPYDRCDD